MKKLFIPVLLVLFGFQGKVQTEDLPDFIFMNGDTTYCVITELARSAGNVTKIAYTDMDGGKHEIAKKDVKDVTMLRIGGYMIDYIPLNPNKPESYKRHIERKVDGKIIIYSHIRLIAETSKNGKRSLYSVVGAGATIYTIKIGKTYYDIKKKTVNDVVAPYLLKCQEFRMGFTDQIKVKNIEDAVGVYNKVCK